MATYKDIIDFMNEIAPVHFAWDFDNVGPMIGRLDKKISKCLLCVDASKEVIEEAVNNDVDLIITHHPFIFDVQNSIIVKSSEDFSKNSLIYEAIENDICIYSAHTNLDSVEGGVNSALAASVGAKNIRPLFEQNCAGKIGYNAIGELPEMILLKDFVDVVKSSMNTPAVKYIGDDAKQIKNVVVSSGSFGDYSEAIAERKDEIDVIVTGELKHGVAVLYNNIGLPMIVVEHYFSERVILPVLLDKLAKQFDSIDFEISKKEYGTFKYK